MQKSKKVKKAFAGKRKVRLAGKRKVRFAGKRKVRFGTKIVPKGIVLGTKSLLLWLNLYRKTLIYRHLYAIKFVMLT